MGILATSDINELIEEIYKQQRNSNNSHRKIRELLFEFFQKKVQGLMSDVNYDYIYLFNRPLKLGLHKITDSILSETKRINKINKVHEFLKEIKEIKLKIQTEFGENKLNEINELQLEILDKIKIMYEQGKLSIFPDTIERIESKKDIIISKLSLNNVKYIKNIGVIIGETNVENFKNVVNIISDVFEERNVVLITKNENQFAEAYITFE